MRFGIVEGEPGIFPEPIARLARAIGRVFRRDDGRPADPGPPGQPDAAAGQDESPDDVRRPNGEGSAT